MTISTVVIEIYRKTISFFKSPASEVYWSGKNEKDIYASIYPQNGKNLNQNEICAVFCLKRQYKIHDGEKWLSEILHIAGLLNSENPVQIQTRTFIKHVLPVKVRAINRLKYTNYRTRKRQEWEGGGLRKHFLVWKRSRMWHPLYDNQ